MMFSLKKIHELYSDDIIYHYTKASTAIDFILYENKLKFSKYRNSIDPMENRNIEGSFVSHSLDTISEEEHVGLNEIDNFIQERKNLFYMLCFCQNNCEESFSEYKGHEENYGFTKYRMWDQYADNYGGVCIAFSKDKILRQNKNLSLISDRIKYYTLQDVQEHKLVNISIDYYRRIGKKKYIEEIDQILKEEELFSKHLDYENENEFRIGMFYEEKTCPPQLTTKGDIDFNTVMLDISNCIKAIFFSSFTNLKQKEELLNYAKKYGVDIFEVNWNNHSMTLTDYKELEDLLNIPKSTQTVSPARGEPPLSAPD